MFAETFPVSQNTKLNWRYINRYTFHPWYTNFTSCSTKHFLFPNILKLKRHNIKWYTFIPWYTNFTSCQTEHFKFRDILKPFYSFYLCPTEPCIFRTYYNSHTWYSIRLWTRSAAKSSVDCSNQTGATGWAMLRRYLHNIHFIPNDIQE